MSDSGQHNGKPKNRVDERVAVEVPASLRLKKRFGMTGRLLNLSPRGCCVFLPVRSIKTGDAVLFKVEPIEAWDGHVRWIENGKIGVEFDRPFHPAVFEMIARKNKPTATSKIA